jgi:tetratricopeptide (TPR) repeat protein
MERRRLIVIGVEGLPIRDWGSTPATPLHLGTDRQVVIFGLSGRHENDAEEALRLVTSKPDDQHRFVIKEIDVLVEGAKPEIDWNKEFKEEIDRIQAGDMLVSPSLARVYDRLFLFEKVEEENTTLYFLRGLRRKPMRVRGLRPAHASLVARDRELARLGELLEQISVDQGQILGLVGDAGIGKTRLTVSLKELAQKRSIPYVEGIHTFSRSSAYEGFRQIVMSLISGKLETLTKWEMTDAETDFLRAMVEPTQRVERLKELNSEQIRQGIFFSVRKLIHAAGRSPLIVIFEDLHWADKDSLELLETLLEGSEATRLLLMLVHRPELAPTWSKRLNYSEMRLSPFSDLDIERFAKTLVGTEQVSGKAVSQLSRLSLGNPFYVEEMIRHLLDFGALEVETDDEGRKSLQLRSSQNSIPSTIHALIASRLDRLPNESSNALRWASLLGSEADTTELEDLLRDQSLEQPGTLLKELFSKNYLSEKSVFPSRRYRFSHDLIYEVVLGGFSDEEMAKRHSAIGHFLEKRGGGQMLERIARHHLRGSDDEAAVRSALKAGHSAISFHQYTQAAEFFRESEKRWQASRKKSVPPHEVYAPLINILFETSDIETVKEKMETWTKEGIDPSNEVQFEYWKHQTRLAFELINYEDSLTNSKRALDALNKLGNRPDERYPMIERRLDALLRLGQLAKALHEGLTTLQELNTSMDSASRARLWARLAYCAVASGSHEVAFDYLGKASALMSQISSPTQQIEFALRKGNILENAQHYKEAIELYSSVIEVAEEAGLRSYLPRLYLSRALMAQDISNHRLALQDYNQAKIEAIESKDKLIGENADFGLIDLLCELGNIPEANRKWEKFTRDYVDTKDPRQKARRAGLAAFIFECNGKFLEAAAQRYIAAEIFTRVEDRIYSSRSMFQAIKLEALAKSKSIEAICKEFGRLVERCNGIESPYLAAYQKEATYVLAAQGGDPLPAPDMEFDPLTCPITHMRQDLAVAKINWLESVRKTEEANELRLRYARDRAKSAEFMAPEYREMFLNHPLYKVPD